MFNNDEKTKELKPLPCGAFKRKVFEMYKKTPDSELRSDILHCQKTVYPHKTEKELKNKQWLNKEVIKELIKYQGVPDGYRNNLSD